jgi:hypothetical protein
LKTSSERKAANREESIMKSDNEMADLARLFYDAYMEAAEEAKPGSADRLKVAFHGITAVGAAFLGSLIGSFYKERPWKRHVFFTGIAMKSLKIGVVGLFSGVFTRQEAVSAWNICAESLVRSPEFFLPEESEAK